MNAANAEPACAGIVFQGRDDHGTTETNGRQKSEDQACQKAEPDTDRDHGKIELQGVLERNRYRLPGEPGNHCRSIEKHQRSEGPSGSRQQYGFGQEMPGQP